jgi:hypothetical protein
MLAVVGYRVDPGSQDKKRLVFRKIRPDRTQSRGKLQSPSDKEKIERLRDEKINADSYTKRTAGRVAATPALQNTPVGLASCTTQPDARRPLEYPHLAVARVYGTDARPPFAPSFRRISPAPQLIFYRGQLPCLIQSTRTPNSSNRFTTICGSNIPNGSSQMANPPCAIRTRRV